MKPLDETKLQIIFWSLFFVAIYVISSLGYEFSQLSIIIVIAISFGGMFAFKKYKEKQRVKELINYANKNNFQYIENSEDSIQAQFDDFKEFNMISSEPLFNLLISEADKNKPNIVTAKKIVRTNNGNLTYYTQIFLFNLNQEIPKFFIKKKSFFETFLPGPEKRIIKGLKSNDYYVDNLKDTSFPKDGYFCFVENEDFRNFITKDFIDLLNMGIEKGKKKINIESNGRALIFYVQNKRHSEQDINYYINLFTALKNSLIE